MSTDTDHPEVALAKSLTPPDYLLVRLNAMVQNRAVLPAAEGWRINTIAQKVTA
jgi:hypothetical protein